MGKLLKKVKSTDKSRSKHKSYWFGRIVFTILIGVFALTMLTPFIWMVSASFKRSLDVMELPIRWIPKDFYPNNYYVVWNIGDYAQRDYHFALAYFNSLKIAIINLCGSVLTSALAGYAFAKIKFRGSHILFLLYLATMMIPSQVTLIPKFVLFSQFGINGTHWSLILPGLFTITGTFLMRQTFIQIPDDFREAAYIDGANEYQIWARVMAPMAKGTMASLAMLVFLWNWNAYLEPLVFLTDWRLHTIPLVLDSFIEETVTQYGLVMAAATSSLIPVFIIFLAGNKFFVKGLMGGAIKA